MNGEEISAADIAAEAQNHVAPVGKPGLAWRAAARALVIQKLMLQEAREKNLVVDPQEIAPGRTETKEDALIRGVTDRAISPAQPTESDVKKVYLASPHHYRAPSLYEPAHILFAVEQGQARDDVKAKAQATLETVLKAPEKFGGLAKDLSQCQSASKGGQLGQINQGETVPEFEAVLETLKPGEIHPEIVETRYGFHIIRLDAKAVGDVLPFDTVRPKIVEALEKAAWVKAARHFTAGLIARAEISGVDFNQ